MEQLIKFTKDGNVDRESFSKLYNERESHYLDLANFVINTNNLDVLKTVMAIKNIIINHEIIN